MRRVGPSGSASILTGAGVLDSLDLIVELDGPLGARAFLFRNAVAGAMPDPCFEMSGASTTELVQVAASGDRRRGYREQGGCG